MLKAISRNIASIIYDLSLCTSLTNSSRLKSTLFKIFLAILTTLFISYPIF